ncbi:MAG: FAD:protein FMN transferase [Desulfobacterales bacterium]
MGTTYHVKVVAGLPDGTDRLKAQIDEKLETLNHRFSNFIPESDISRFNRSADTETECALSPDFFYVMVQAKQIHKLSHGAWDGTVKPLVELWGFGSDDALKSLPSREKIGEILKRTGFDRIELKKGGLLRKTHPQVTLDLASIAKGYGVDAVSELLRSNGYHNFIVEIGGEVYASGVRKDKNLWRVGVNTPHKDAAFDDIHLTVELKNRAMATSGDYRNFTEIGGVPFSHIIDPRTGYPVKNGVVSASVISGNCTLADGLATALMVMGPNAGIEMIDRITDTECLIIVRNPDGSLTDHYSKGFPH